VTTASVTIEKPRLASANAALNRAAKFWFLVAVAGQWAFLYYIAAFYGPSTFGGNFQAWNLNRMLFKGYVAGDTAGNLAFAAHALLAGVIAFGGALQLMPRLRQAVPALHRWNGRVFLVTALGLSLSGLYMVWVRHANPTLTGDIGTSMNAALIIGCGAMAWRAARARDFERHRRWALRTYMVANAQWFTRVGAFAWIIVTQGAALGAFFRFWTFGCFLVPLAMLELYLRTQDAGSPRLRYAMAGGLVASGLLMIVGIVGVAALVYGPLLAKA